MGKVSDKVTSKRKAALSIQAPPPQVAPPRPVRNRCAQCYWWDIEGRPAGMGLCRGATPQLIMENGVMRAYWPVLNKDEWCAVFKPA